MPKTPLDVYKEDLQRGGLEGFGKYYGIYRGICTDNNDPDGRRRIKAKCPTAGHGAAPDVWIDPASTAAGDNHGFFWPPEIGDAVWMSFESGDPRRPNMYLGGWYGKEDVPAEMAYTDGVPYRRGIITRAGHQLVFVDEPGKEGIRLIWHKPADGDESLSDQTKTADRSQGDFSFLAFTSTGGVQISNKDGSNIHLDSENGAIAVIDSSGNSITLDGDGTKVIDNKGNALTMSGSEITLMASDKIHLVAPTVNIKGGTVVVGDTGTFSQVVGEILKVWLTAHTHTTATGPSGPPIVPPPENILSQGAKVRT